jgi:hypothetical protein
MQRFGMIGIMLKNSPVKSIGLSKITTLMVLHGYLESIRGQRLRQNVTLFFCYPGSRFF